MGGDFCVGYLRLPLYAQKLSEAVCVEIIKFLGVPVVDCSRFTAIQRCNENHCTVDLDLRLYDDPSSVPYVLV